MAPVQSKLRLPRNIVKENTIRKSAKGRGNRKPPTSSRKSESDEVSRVDLHKMDIDRRLSQPSAICSAEKDQVSTNKRVSGRRKKQTIFDNSEYHEASVDKHNIGDMNQVCRHCGALMFEVERQDRGVDFQMCCCKGKVPVEYMRVKCPPGIRSLLSDPNNEDFRHFHQFIRQYNSAMAVVSTGVNVVDSINNGQCSWIFKIHGQVYHNIYNGVRQGDQPKHNQVYFYDPKEAAALRKGISYNKMLKESILEMIDVELRQSNAFYLSHKRLFEVEEEMLQRAGQAEIENLCLVFRVTPTTKLDRWNAPTADEVSAVYKPGSDGRIERDFAVYLRSREPGVNNSVRVQCRSRYVEPMSYPLFYPEGGIGWGQYMKGFDHAIRNISQREFYAAKLFERQGEFNPILHGGRLTQQYVVDMRMMVEQQKLDYIKTHQQALLVDSYMGLQDFLDQVSAELGLGVGKKVICPATVVESDRWYREQYMDAMAMVQKLGRPDLFITFTCNPDWPEIKNNLKPWQTAADRPDLVARVFMHKSKAILDDVLKNNCLGKVKAYCYTVEFQKRGLPHIHLLVIFQDDSKISDPQQIDKIISAELPDPTAEPELYKIVTGCMVGPCFISPEKRVCRQKNIDKCSKHYPRQLREVTELADQGYPLYRRRRGPKVDLYSKGKRVTIDNSWVVPYNKTLTQKYQCHINVEACISIRSVKYIYKYIYKGGDRADMIIQGTDLVHWDEVEQYLDAIYMTPPQASWELFKGKKQEKSHAVARLSVHLPNEFNVHFKAGEERKAYESASKKQTQLTAFFKLCESDLFARSLLYEELPDHYTFATKTSSWTRKSGSRWSGKVVARIYSVSPKDVERYYLRLLMFHVRGPTSYEAVRTVNNVVYPSYRAAAVALGLVEDDTEWFRCMEEAAVYKMPKQLRSLFSYILEFNRPANAEVLWDTFRTEMSEDFLKDGFSEDDAYTMALLDVETFMNAVAYFVYAATAAAE